MSTRDQLASKTDAKTGKVLPEGFVQLVTSAGNKLAFATPAEAELYRAANRAQIKNSGFETRAYPNV